VPRDYRNRIISNALMVIAVLLFGVLGVQEIIGLIQG
jgi:hypothetical protein